MILLCDDDEVAREFGRQTLSEAGYTVLTASNGREALDIYRRERKKIALVILDLLMPVMSGKQCFETLRKVDPKVRGAVASGYSPEGPVGDAVGSKAAGFITRPCKVRQLRRIVREPLDAKR